MIIRPIQVSDAPVIQKINAMELGYTILLEQMEERIVALLQESNHHYLFVAEIDNQVVGYVHAQRYDSLLAECGLILWHWQWMLSIKGSLSAKR
ncbi:hypothetical protein JDW15_08835 [Aerococcaceae bacterium zg-ZJ1578]|uniref:N-acetyltransferase family protein n=1 Tax=Aerococcaceae bacterium zg-252 TaxID=2796928 RepID=UPI001A336864|nr:hypothetical protein [Aerococcaceae bacterium zg-1578]